MFDPVLESLQGILTFMASEVSGSLVVIRAKLLLWLRFS